MPKHYSAFDGVEDVEDVPLRSPDQEGFTYPSTKHQRVSTVYDDIDSEDGLLDWHHLNRLRKYTIFGFNVAPVVDFVTLRAPPGMPEREVRKRRAICISSAVAVVVGIIFICVLASQSAAPPSGAQRQAAASSGAAGTAAAAAPTPPATPTPVPTPPAETTPPLEPTPLPPPAEQQPSEEHADEPPAVDWTSIPAGDLCSWQSLYLPDTVVPDVYTLRLEVPLVAPYQLSGHADVALNITAATNCIVLHSVGITINSVAIKDGETAIAGRVYGDPIASVQQVALQFAASLEPSNGRYVLHLHFEYALQEGVDGLYLSKYTDRSGGEHMLVASQFESVAARKAFPCFDEPRFKAKFRVDLQTPNSPVVALSNMPEMSAVAGDQPNTVLHQFGETPYMSPYLLGIVVGELSRNTFDCPTPAGVPISAYGTADRLPQLQVAPAAACTAVQQMETLTGMPFPLPKLDLVAVPEFAAGAMENWGLILYNEVDLLVDSVGDDMSQRFDVAATVAHEVSHQWFGDLVTCSSWSELWLNEGFATYFENALATAIVPQYQYFDYFYPEITAKALNDDAMASSHPLTVLEPLASVGAVDNLFDAVMYEKGAAVLRMLRAFLARESSTNPDNTTGDVFLSGLRVYLQSKQYSTATYEDLWKSITVVAAGPVDDWMNTWTLRKNFPLVSIQLSPSGHVITRQHPFTTAAGPNQPAPECTTEPQGSWWIPFSYRFQASPTVFWQPFSSCTGRMRYVLHNYKSEYVLANPGRYGFYRVNYQTHNWGLLAAAASSMQPSDAGYIADVDFAGLLDDSFRLSEAGQLAISYFLDLAAALPSRRQPDVYSSWAIAKSSFDKITLLLRNGAGIVPQADCIKGLLDWLRTNITSPYITNVQLTGENVGISFDVTMGGSESTQTRRLRPLLLSAGAQYGDADLIAEAQGLLMSAEIMPDVRSAVYRAALADGNPEVYDKLLELYHQTTEAKDKRRLLNALATAPTPELIQRTLDLAVSPDVRLSDMGALFKSIGSEGGVSFNLTWEFILGNTDRIMGRYPGGEGDVAAAYSFGRAAKTLASLFVDEAALPRVAAWAESYRNILDPEFVGIVQENLSQNRRWLETEGQGVCAWLTARG